MKKDQMIQYCLDNIKEFGLALERSKCAKGKIKLLVKHLNNPLVKNNYVNLVYKHLKHMAVPYLVFKGAWDLVSEEKWAFYDMMDYEHLREQDILEDACKKFKKAWNNLPRLIKKEHMK